MTETTPSPLKNVITIDDERIKSHLDRVVRGSVEETLNALLDAEADRLCNAQRYERSEARRDTRAGHYERKLQTKASEVKIFLFRSDTVDGDTRVPHSASVISSTRRTETPARYISINASSTELSRRR